MTFKAGQRVIFARQRPEPFYQISAPVGSLAEVSDPPYSGGGDCYLNIKWLDPSHRQMDGGYHKESFDSAEPTDQELADKWRELALEARNIRRQLQNKGLKLQSNSIGSNTLWNTPMALGEESIEYRFYKIETPVPVETIL